MTVDKAAERANESGWTRDAIKAEKKAAEKAKKEAKREAFRARVAAVLGGISSVARFIVHNQLLWMGIAALAASGGWEWWNSARGWLNLYPTAGVFAYVGAAGAVGLYFTAFALWRQHARRKAAADDPKVKAQAGTDQFIWLTVTISSYVVCVAGVFVAVATGAELADRAAKESRAEYQRLVLQRDDLRDRVELNDPELLQMVVDQDRKKLVALTDTAKGTHGMVDLEPGSGCPAPPKKFMLERLCAQANGGIDPFSGEVISGVRSDIVRQELGLKKAKEAAGELVTLEAAVKNFKVRQGDETAAALGQMFTANGGTVMGWLLLLLSSCFLYGGGWLADWVFERIEQLIPRKKTAKV